MSRYDDLWLHPDMQKWKSHVEGELAGKIGKSQFTMSLCPPKGKPDAKYAVELGMSIMLDKPLLIVAPTNDDIPPKLRLVADKVVIGDWTEPNFHKRIADAIQEFAQEQGWNNDEDD